MTTASWIALVVLAYALGLRRGFLWGERLFGRLPR